MLNKTRRKLNGNTFGGTVGKNYWCMLVPMAQLTLWRCWSTSLTPHWGYSIQGKFSFWMNTVHFNTATTDYYIWIAPQFKRQSFMHKCAMNIYELQQNMIILCHISCSWVEKAFEESTKAGNDDVVKYFLQSFQSLISQNMKVRYK